MSQTDKRTELLARVQTILAEEKPKILYALGYLAHHIALEALNLGLTDAEVQVLFAKAIQGAGETRRAMQSQQTGDLHAYLDRVQSQTKP